MTSLKRKSNDLTTTTLTYPCDCLPDDVLHYILSFLPNKDFVKLKVLSKRCNEKFDAPYYWRVMTLHLLHDMARDRVPSMKKVSEEEIDGWDSERLIDECQKQSIKLGDKPERAMLLGHTFTLTPAQRESIPGYKDYPEILRKALKKAKAK
jgi:hypothetical protein